MRKVWVALTLVVPLLAAGLTVRALKQSKVGSSVQSSSTPTASSRPPHPIEVAEALYDSQLGPGWEDWGWGPHKLQAGPAQISFAGFGGLLLHHAELPWRFGGLAFRYKAPAGWPEFLSVSLRSASSPDDTFPTVAVEPRHVAALADGWREVLVGWSELNPNRRPLDRVAIAARTAVPADWVLLDKIVLTKPAPSMAAVAPQRDETLSVLCGAAHHPIDPLIYGASTDDWESGQSAKRMGGNPHTRLNFDLGAWNTGSDWFFQNVAGAGTFWDWIGDAAKAGRTTAVVVPISGWMAKDSKSFGFPRAKFGQQRKHDPHRPESGDGHEPDGTPIRPGHPSETSVPAPPALIGSWVRKLVAGDVARGSRAVHMYILDNEPSLWNTTHRDIHPEPVSYDELLERTLQYATAIREADPQAVIAGPAEWGWTGYMYSAVDREAGTLIQPDRRAHGGVALVPWYLQKLAAHEKVTGMRLLDVLDLHMYPSAEGVYGEKAGTDPATAELRLRSTRSLWDPGYREESWVKDTIRLIPRMKQWVLENYPGRKVAIGEWSFGAEQHISGGLATAEALGRFGQHGLDAAFHWGGLRPGTPTYWAFRAYRNFDDEGARFQDVSLTVQETPKVSLFASRDDAATRIVLVLINRDPVVQVNAAIALQGCGRVASSRMFSYGSTSTALSKVDAVTSQPGGVRAAVAPYSFAVLDLRLEPPARQP